MLFWLMVILFFVGVVLVLIDEKLCTCIIDVIGIVVGFLSGCVALVMLVIIVANHAGVAGTVEKELETYKALCYKVESENCRDEFGLLNKEIVDEVQEWNEGVKYSQKMQRDFWLGIFYPNIYDQFETIEYK